MKTKFTRQLLLIALLSLTHFFVQAQQNLVDIPDGNFKLEIYRLMPSAFVNFKLDANHPSVKNLEELNLFNLNISNLEGIKYFAGLKRLSCINNLISSFPVLPVSLTTIVCRNNKLTSLENLPSSLQSLQCGEDLLSASPVLPDSLLDLYWTSKVSPVLPNSLLELRWYSAALPVLPNSLKILYYSNTNLPIFPSSLKELHLTNIALVNIPSLPDSLESLDCRFNNLTSLPQLPSTLKTLGCDNNQITALPSLPASLTMLTCRFNQLIKLPDLPESLRYLDCSINQLSSLPHLPDSLITFNCQSNKLTSFPNVPAVWTEFICGDNLLTSLPVMPKKIRVIYCSKNKIEQLPQLSDSLKYLSCSANNLTELPDLPGSLKAINCSGNRIKQLPLLPNSLDSLDCSDNQLTTLPILPPLLAGFSCHSNKITCLPFLPSEMHHLIIDSTLCLPNVPNDYFQLNAIIWNLRRPIKVYCNETTNSNNCIVYQKATGKVFIDYDNDGIYSKDSDGPYPHAVIKSTPYLTDADTAGNYSITFENLKTDYTITPVIPAGFTVSPASYTVNFADYNTTLSGKDFILTPSQTINDLSVQLSAVMRPRPGFEASYWITVKNTGTTIQNAHVQFVFDSHLIFVNADSQGSLSNNTLSWNISNFKPFEEKVFKVSFTLPSNVSIGTGISCSVSVSPNSDDNTPDDNMTQLKQLVSGSFDPNDKAVDKGDAVTPLQIQNLESFGYTVRFQNTGNDIAETVIIKDTISTYFDLNTIQTVAASHNYSFKMKNNVAYWTFDKIMLPDSNVNKAGSNGFVKYTIKPLSTLVLGNEIRNTAYIQFDYNADVVTNTTTTLVSNTNAVEDDLKNSQSIQVYPNPSKGLFHISIPNNTGNTNIEIYSVEGLLVQSFTTLETETSISLAGQSSGLYILKIKGNNFSEVKRIILQ